MLENMLKNEEFFRAQKQWKGALSNYTQEHCHCTLENEGYRIYRTPNLIYPDSGNVMWGGLVINNYDNILNLKSGHSYIVLMDVKGKTSNSMCDIYLSNSCGWGGGGLLPNPIDEKTKRVPSDFNSSHWITIYHKWTIPSNDPIYKKCTSAYSDFKLNETYVSYKHLKFGFSYTNTGSLGTDLYIRNLRMYDITNLSKNDVRFLKTGNIESTLFSEGHEKMNIGKYAEINTNNIIEN